MKLSKPFPHPALAVLVSAITLIPLRSGAAADPASVDQRVDAILARMTLDQKIDLIGGVDDFFVRGYPDLGWPRLKMADGPMGVRNWGPATALPGGHRARRNLGSPDGAEHRRGPGPRLRAPRASTSCSVPASTSTGRR